MKALCSSVLPAILVWSFRLPSIILLLGIVASQVASDRTVVPLTRDWRFVRQDVPLAASAAAWEKVDLPHSWNARDGQDGPTPGGTARPGDAAAYYRGMRWYAKTFDVPAEWRGRRVFVMFDAVSQRAVVYANGARGEHTGGVTAFCCELTSIIRFGGANELRVQVNNTLVKTITSLAGDFNVDGGIYRPVHLLITEPVHISPLECASPGVFLTPLRIDDAAAEVEIKTLLSNGGSAAVGIEVETTVIDAKRHGHARNREASCRAKSLRPRASLQAEAIGRSAWNTGTWDTIPRT